MNYVPLTRRPVGVTDLALAEHDKLGTRKLLESHRASGVKLLRTDADLRPEPELPPVGKPGRGVDEDDPGIHLAQEALRATIVARHDPLRQARAVPVDVRHRLLKGAHDLDGQDQVEILGLPIGFGGLANMGQDRPRSWATLELDPRPPKHPTHLRQEP